MIFHKLNKYETLTFDTTLFKTKDYDTINHEFFWLLVYLHLIKLCKEVLCPGAAHLIFLMCIITSYILLLERVYSMINWKNLGI